MSTAVLWELLRTHWSGNMHTVQGFCDCFERLRFSRAESATRAAAQGDLDSSWQLLDGQNRRADPSQLGRDPHLRISRLEFHSGPWLMRPRGSTFCPAMILSPDSIARAA